MQEENPLNYLFLEEETVNYREKIEKYVFYWKWFVLAIVLAIVSSYFYLRYTPKEYQASTTILIDNEQNGGLANELSAFGDLGLMGSTKKVVENEIGILKSNSLMQTVVKDLGLNISYFEKGHIQTSELFKEKSPIKITFFSKDSLFYKLDTTFTINITTATQFNLVNEEGDQFTKHVFGENIKSTMGNFIITPTNMDKSITDREVIVHISPLKSVVEDYRSQLVVDLLMKKSDLLQITLKDNIKLKAEALLNNLVDHYNKNAIENKSLIAINTNNFIIQRLNAIKQDLSAADKGIQQFKTTNKLTNIPAEADLILNTNSATAQKIIDLTTQLKLTSYVADYLATNSEDLIPANLGLADGSISANSIKYNELLLERNRILKSSSNLNPVIVNLNTQINELRRSVTQSLVNLKSSLTISLSTMKQQEAQLNSKIVAVPTQEREFRDIQRQQQIIETLYLYLLQKREENSISLVATVPNAKIIDPATVRDIPVSPKPIMIYLIAILLGFLVPFIGFYIMFLFDNKVQTAKEVEEAIKAPFLGDIPKTKLVNKLVVSDSDRNSEAEAFRMLRTNINFMLNKVKEECKTICVTSTLPNEGKTFIAINLAAVLALSNKKVLLIGSDIRKPKIAEYLDIPNGEGLTSFLMDEQFSASDVIESVPVYNFDVVQSGIVPPNPSELLMNGRFEELIAYAKTKYDYIIVDTSPVSLVSDTLLLSQKADLFIYVVRANYLDKRMLEIPKKLYKENKLPNMALLLNDTQANKGYGYGGYGYGYGGYGYGEKEIKKPWWKKIKT
jgi:tyrosine-protein kinase Etk/Wzc